MKAKPRFILQEPVNWENLAQAYRLAKWRWSGGFPSAQEIQTAADSIKEAAVKSGGYCSSGGITVTAKDGECQIAVDNALYIQLPLDTPGRIWD